MLYWPGLSRSFRTQSHWSFITGQCIYSCRTISSSTFDMLDVRSFYTPSQIQVWYREDKIQAGKDRRYSSRLWILWTKNTEIRTKLTWKHRVLHGTIRKSGRNIKTRCIGSTSNLLKWKDLSSIKHDRTRSSFTTHSQIILSRRTYEKVCASPRPPPKISFKDNWMKELVSEVAGGSEDSQQTQP